MPEDGSPRRLQELFHERGHHIADRTWTRRLTDPASLHLPIGTLAYDCGFTGQAHVSRRSGTVTGCPLGKTGTPPP